MLPYQTPGISNQALVFMRDVKMFASWTDIFVKSAIFDNTPAEKWFGPRIFVTWNFLQNLISTFWDSFHGTLHMTFSSVSQMDKMLTLNWSHSITNSVSRTLYRFVHHTWGASKSMTKDGYFKPCTGLVQEQVYAWVIASSFVMLLEAPKVWRTKWYNILKTELVYTLVGVLGQLPTKDNSPPVKTIAQPLPTGTTIPRTIPH